MYVDEIRYKARFCGGPLNGLEEVLIARNGVLIDKIGKPFPTEHGFSCVEYARDGYPDDSGVVAYRWQDYERVEILLTPDERVAIRRQLAGEGLDCTVRSVLNRLLRNGVV